MDKKFSSRAGAKLAFAINKWHINVQDKICADLGCSTGGFTDCLLKSGAKKVYAVDTGYGVLDWKLRNDNRVVVMERANALYLELQEKVDFISIDVGWTPQKTVLPKALSLLNKGGNIISLLKPHYEADKGWLVKGKLRPEYLDRVIGKVKNELKELNIAIEDITESPLAGAKSGNKEYLLWIKNID